jgi:diguanylate cyclase (GGDEF)-like protein/PAS domain S-box-containing protein
MQLALEAAKASVWESDLRTGEIQFSEGWARMLGLPADPVRTTLDALWTLMDPQDAAKVKAAVLVAMKGTTDDFSEEHRVRTAQGAWIWLRTAGRVIERDAAGRALRLAGTNFDITGEKREANLLDLEHAITRCLAEGETPSAGVQAVLRTICESQQWEAARFLRVDAESNVMRCTESWNIEDPALERFPENARNLTFARGEGVVGRVWETCEPIWVPELGRDPRVRNTALYKDFGIRSAFAFPVTAEGDTVGILSTFSRNPKPPDERLLSAVRVIGAQLGQFLRRKEAEERLAYLAQFDSLTSLPNRNLFKDRLQQALLRAKRNGCQAALLFADLDQFKRVNDTLGHALGDQLLALTAARLQECLREGDTLARLGGDEFAIVLPDQRGGDAAATIARRILEALRSPFRLGTQELYVGASLGITMYPDDGADAETLLRNADAAMYRAKHAGRNGFQFFTRQMSADAAKRLALEMDLRHALERRELELHYQPKAQMRGGDVAGAEALLRWRRPDGALVPPGEFVPVLEETGLIAEVGDWVVREACRQLVKWNGSVPARLAVAVNVSAQQLQEGRIVTSVRAALAETGCAPERLQVEITESTAMADLDVAVRILGELRALGVKVAIDDFGTGHSSLAYLQRLPIDIVKVDRTFVRNITESPKDEAIASAIVAIAEAFGYRVVAEGVETPAQRDYLAALGCHEMQGYLLSWPLPPEQFVEWLRTRRAERTPALI